MCYRLTAFSAAITRMQYRIGEFAELSGVSAKTLRHYDKLGLLRPEAVDSRTRYRGYTAAQLRELSSILALRDLGLSLTEIRTFVSKTGSSANRRALLLRLRQNTQQMIEKATRSLNGIDAALDEEIDQSGVWTHAVPVAIKRRSALRVATLRAEFKSYVETDVLRLEGELLSALPSEALGAMRGVMWQRCARTGSLIAEPFVEVRRDLARRSFYDVKDLPAVTAACAFSGNDAADAERTYSAINTWMAARGFSLASPKREVYLDDILEIQFPLEGGCALPSGSAAEKCG